MNELHHYPPDWDNVDITELPEYQGLLTKNAEALFASKSVNDDFLVRLSETQVNDLGCDLVTALGSLLKQTNTDRMIRDHHYAILISEQLSEMKNILADLASKHVQDETIQEFEELNRAKETELLIEVAGYY